MTDIETLTYELIQFHNARNCTKCHNSKNLTLFVSVKVAELNELFFRETTKESEKIEQNKLKEELANAIAFALLLSDRHDFYVTKSSLKNQEKQRKIPC